MPITSDYKMNWRQLTLVLEHYAPHDGQFAPLLSTALSATMQSYSPILNHLQTWLEQIQICQHGARELQHSLTRLTSFLVSFWEARFLVLLITYPRPFKTNHFQLQRASLWQQALWPACQNYEMMTNSMCSGIRLKKSNVL